MYTRLMVPIGLATLLIVLLGPGLTGQTASATFPPPAGLRPVPASVWSDQIVPNAGQAEENPLPLYVTVYYHVEPNRQFFETIEPGYFEAVSSSLRGMSRSLASIHVPATFCFAWLYNFRPGRQRSIVLP